MAVTAEYGSGIVDPLFTGSVMASLAACANRWLEQPGRECSATAVKGVATFPGLTLDKAVAGYAIKAASSATGARCR